MKNEKIIRLLLEMLELDSSEYVRLMVSVQGMIKEYVDFSDNFRSKHSIAFKISHKILWSITVLTAKFCYAVSDR